MARTCVSRIFRRVRRFSVTDGHPTFKKTYTDPVDANAYAAELIKHTYRDGWVLPDMPE